MKSTEKAEEFTLPQTGLTCCLEKGCVWGVTLSSPSGDNGCCGNTTKRESNKGRKETREGGQAELVLYNTDLLLNSGSWEGAAKQDNAGSYNYFWILFSFFLFVFYFFFLKTQFHYIVHVGFELMIFLTQPPQC